MFGQTGSGKTHTMTNFEDRLAERVFAGGASAEMRYFEVCGKRALDLLRASDAGADPEGDVAPSRPKPLEVVDGCAGGVVPDAISRAIDAPAAFADALRRGRTRRQTASTDVNGGSSRSHAVCRLDFYGRGGGSLTLIDCAGSERSSDSMYHDAARRRESAEINQSLYALKQCIRAARQVHVWRKRGADPDRAPAPPPFRASALTRVLREALTSPEALLAVVATVSPAATDAEHSVATLRAVAELAGTTAAAERASDARGAVVPKARDAAPGPGVASRGPPLPPFPRAWSAKRLAAFLATKLGLDAFAARSADLGLDGKRVARMSVPALATALTGGDADAASKIARALRSEHDKCDKLHAAAREKRRRSNRGYDV